MWFAIFVLTILPLTYKSVPMQEFFETSAEEDSTDTYKVICYFTNWGAHRSIKESRLYPEDIPPHLCTHILYAFGVINGLSIQHTIPNDIQDYEDQKPLFGRIMELKRSNPKLKILISCGGWGASGQFESIVGSNDSRTMFSQNVITFCRKWNFDGIDLDWEFPSGHHKTNFGLLAETMYKEFDKESKKTGRSRLLTSIATAAGSWLLNQGYDIPVLCKWLDMVNVMTYDLYGNWYNKVGGHSALYHAEGETGQDRELNTNSSIYNWLDRGCLRHKLSIGIPSYGRAFGGSGNDPLKMWGQSSGGSGGLSSKYLGESGVQTYFEVCMRIKEGYTKHWDDVHKYSIAYKQGTWIGYDDPRSVLEKCKYVEKEKLAGAMIWTLDMDDFKGEFCNNGSYPVVRTISDCFKRISQKTTTKKLTTTTVSVSKNTTTEQMNDFDEYKSTKSGSSVAINYAPLYLIHKLLLNFILIKLFHKFIIL